MRGIKPQYAYEHVNDQHSIVERRKKTHTHIIIKWKKEKKNTKKKNGEEEKKHNQNRRMQTNAKMNHQTETTI